MKLLPELNIHNSTLLIELGTPNNPFQSLRQMNKPMRFQTSSFSRSVLYALANFISYW